VSGDAQDQLFYNCGNHSTMVGLINITGGAATSISYTVPPSNTVAGATIAPAIVVHVQDTSHTR
jgi:hypothetical protein